MSPRKSVLIVDNSDRQTRFIERGLRRADHALAIFTLPDGGERVLERLERAAADLVVLDRSMDVDGFRTLELIRGEVRFANLPVIMVTGSDDADHIAHARHVGADGYMVKPGEEDGYDLFGARLASWSLVESWRVPPAEIVRSSCGSDVLTARRVDSAVVSVSKEDAGNYPAGHLNYAAHVAQIPLSLALNTSVKDHGVMDKRRNFARVLFSLGWSKPEIRLYLAVSLRWLEEQQGKPVQDLCVLRAALLK